MVVLELRAWTAAYKAAAEDTRTTFPLGVGKGGAAGVTVVDTDRRPCACSRLDWRTDGSAATPRRIVSAAASRQRPAAELESSFACMEIPLETGVDRAREVPGYSAGGNTQMKCHGRCDRRRQSRQGLAATITRCPELPSWESGCPQDQR